SVSVSVCLCLCVYSVFVRLCVWSHLSRAERFGEIISLRFFPQILRLRFNMRFFFCILFFSQQNVMNDLNMTNTILDTFSVKYSFPHFTFLFNCSLQKQEQQIGGFA